MTARPLIFISYSSTDRELTRALAAAIETQYGAGSVWWDHALESWGDYEIQIRNALEAARVVVVLWSRAASASDWVKSEAGRANAGSKLVNVRTPGTAWRDVPSPYDQHHVNDLSDTTGILRSIDGVWTGRTVRTSIPLHEVFYRQHGHRLVDPRQRALPGDLRDASPSELLQAVFEVVGYQDVTGTEAQLLDWCANSARPASARLIHGAGGVGKTRLMISVASRLRRDGWAAGFLTRPPDPNDATLKQRRQAIEQLVSHSTERGVLLVVDYAEARQDDLRLLARFVSERTEAGAPLIRVIALARSAGEWWANLHNETPEIQRLFRKSGDAAAVIELPSVAPLQRVALFEASVAAFAPLLEAQGAPRRTGAPSRALLERIETDDSYSRPLAIQMEALVWLISPAAGVTTSIEDLLRFVLGLERQHWRKVLGELDDEQARDLARGVAQVTAVQGAATIHSAERLLMADAFYKGRRAARVDVDQIRRALARVYGRDDALIPLEPDLIGEHHVASVGDSELVDGCVQWIEGEPDAAREAHRRDLLTVLQRATQPEHGQAAARAGALLGHLIESHGQTMAAALVAVMIDTPGQLANVLERKLPELQMDPLRAIDDAVPTQTVSLLDLSMKIAAQRVALTKHFLPMAGRGWDVDPRDVKVDLAARLGVLGMRLSFLGRLDDALAASQEAVAIHRELQDTRPKVEADFGKCLNNLGNMLTNVGRDKEALAVVEESVAIYRRLAEVMPELSLRLAATLSSLGGALSKVGRLEEALVASQEGVEVYRRLAESGHSNEFLADLASSLNNLGIRLSDLGRLEEALAASDEAVRIYRRLSETGPDAFLPDLAAGLNNLGIRLSDLERHEEALVAVQECVSIRRRLVEAHPDAFFADLASILSNLGIELSHVARHEEALETTQESLAIRRRLAAAHPDAYLPQVAISLNNLGVALSNLARQDEALAASEESVAIRRRLATTRPQTFLPSLAGSLHNLGEDLSSVGRHQEALATNDEAIGVFRQLAGTHPNAFSPNLAKAISLRAGILAQLDRPSDAVEAAREALTIIAPFAERRPDVFGGRVREMVRDLRRYSREAPSMTLDEELVGRVERAIGDSPP